MIQNAAAHLITKATKYEHIKPVLRSLHWLPVWQRITFKTAVSAYKCLHDVVPPYLTDLHDDTSDAGR